ncbi:MAG: hypothetical protein KJ057_09470 [Phycisphaerae bacterium]|nr:MAG: hypothetical protein F9K17_01120 [Phycisphaerae bacterium]MBE7458557.1 hypothetical protein [Planctomycetia bacterium]MCK6465014.1 hypothetical protein [Phycisphaerae bacterium]MCL4718688.1 hypothetical protein [Phycisphaerae bacterium]NUQ08309.1 hypothetical protein [Phycisphaerae bacterium]
MRSWGQRKAWRLGRRSTGLGLLLALGGCEFGTISIPVTLDVDDLLITLVRGLVITPIDQFVTEQITDAFEDDE